MKAHLLSFGLAVSVCGFSLGEWLNAGDRHAELTRTIEETRHELQLATGRATTPEERRRVAEITGSRLGGIEAQARNHEQQRKWFIGSSFLMMLSFAIGFGIETDKKVVAAKSPSPT
jgi:hypothetical protein